MAGKYLGAQDIILNRDARIIVLEHAAAEQKRDYEKRINLLAANLNDQKNISLNYQKHSQSFADELQYYQKINKKQKRQNVVLRILLIGAAGVIADQLIN